MIQHSSHRNFTNELAITPIHSQEKYLIFATVSLYIIFIAL